MRTLAQIMAASESLHWILDRAIENSDRDTAGNLAVALDWVLNDDKGNPMKGILAEIESLRRPDGRTKTARQRKKVAA